MFLLIVFLSYLLGCASTIALLLYLYTRYVLYAPVKINEQAQDEEQYQTFHPLPENERAKNSAVDTVNYLFQFLFQELKDSSRLRRYIMHKLNTEFKELKTSGTGKFFLQNIVIQKFSIGKKCPTFSDIQLVRQERDERHLIKEFVAKLNADYKDGFSVTLDVTLLFGAKCQLYIKVKHIQGLLHLEFRREPFCHWLLVFQDEPLIDFEVKSYYQTKESPQLANIITQQLRRAIKRKQTWPSYKIRYQPFFPTSKQSLATEVLSSNGNNLIPGVFDILIKHCDRLSIPLVIFEKQKVSVFLTINVNEQTCLEYLRINRDLWKEKEIELTRNVNKIIVKEVNYMDRTELLIEELDPIPNGIEDSTSFKAALEDKNIFLLKMQGQEVKTMKQVHRLLKHKSTAPSTDGTTATTTSGQEDRIQILVGMPILHSVRVQRVLEPLNNTETEKPGVISPALSLRSEGSTSTPTLLRHRAAASAVKFDKSIDTIAIASKQSDGDEEQPSSPKTTDASVKPTETNIAKKPRNKRNSATGITLIMMNADNLRDFQGQPTPTQKAESYIEFNNRFEFQTSANEKFLNICLWCKPPLDCDVPNAGKKLILLGYATVALSEIVLDAHLSYKRETQMTLNFRSAYSMKPNSKKRNELSTHKGYDENLSHGFVTINIKHQPDIDLKLNAQEKKEQFIANGPILTDICTKLKEDERKQDQLKYINIINEHHEVPARKSTDHLFEDKSFAVATLCAYCERKIWLKSGRQCRDCLVTIHKKCEDKFIADNICKHEPVQFKSHPSVSPSDDDLTSLVNIEIIPTPTAAPTTAVDENDSISIKSNYELVSNSNTNRTTTIPPTTAHRFSSKAAAALSALDSTARRSFRAFGSKTPHQPTTTIIPSLSSTSELSKSDESLNNPIVTPTKKPDPPPPVHTTSKIANAASSAYSKLREFKSKRLPTTSGVVASKQNRSPTESASNENILETDLRDILTKCLSDENKDTQSLESLLHERAVDDTVLYAKALEFGPELFRELTSQERKQKLESEIFRLRQEIDFQSQTRDELIQECEVNSIDENEKRKLRAKISNIDEKVQALGALSILYCSGLKHCCAQLGLEESLNRPISELPADDDNDEFDDSRNEIDDNKIHG